MNHELPPKAKVAAEDDSLGFDDQDQIAKNFFTKVCKEHDALIHEIETGAVHLVKERVTMAELLMRLETRKGKSVYSILENKIALSKSIKQKFYEKWMVEYAKTTIEISTDNLKDSDSIAQWMTNEIRTNADKYEEQAYYELLKLIWATAGLKKQTKKLVATLFTENKIGHLPYGFLSTENN